MAFYLIFGTALLDIDMTDFQDTSYIKGLLKPLRDLGVNRLNTTARYLLLLLGRAEELLNRVSELSYIFLLTRKSIRIKRPLRAGT